MQFLLRDTALAFWRIYEPPVYLFQEVNHIAQNRAYHTEVSIAERSIGKAQVAEYRHQ